MSSGGTGGMRACFLEGNVQIVSWRMTRNLPIRYTNSVSSGVLLYWEKLPELFGGSSCFQKDRRIHLILRSLYTTLLPELELIFSQTSLKQTFQAARSEATGRQECAHSLALTRWLHPLPPPRFEIEKRRDDHSPRPLCVKMGNVTQQVLPCI